MNFKIAISILFISVFSYSFGQEVAFREVINSFIFSKGEERAERLKHTKQIEKVKIFYYNIQDLDTLQPSKNVFEMGHLFFDKEGKLTSKIYEDLEDNKNWIENTYDDQGRLTKKVTYYLSDTKEKEIIENMTFEYLKDKVVQIYRSKKMFDFYAKREFFLTKNKFIDKIVEYEEDNTRMKFRSFFLDFYGDGDFWDYVEGISTKKEILKAYYYDRSTFDNNGRIISISDYDSKDMFIYKDNSIIKNQKVYKVDGEEIIKINYVNDEKGNWIKKTYIYKGKLEYYITREVTYRK